MGLLDRLRGVLGSAAEADATRAADPDDLWGMSTAYLTMAADLDMPSAGTAALCFSDVDSTDFRDTVREVSEILEAGRADTGTHAEVATDDVGYRWVVLEDDDPEDLVTSVHFAADTFVERGYGSRLLAALFAFVRDPGDAVEPGTAAASQPDADGPYLYWVYSFRRGAYYPFAPEPDHDRDSTAEVKLQSVLDGELDIEDETEYWYPLWPDGAGRHPWE